MSTEDEMTIDERLKYPRRMKKRYRQANRKEQGRLLDEMEAITELHRKSLIRLMNGSLERTPGIHSCKRLPTWYGSLK